MVIGVGLVLTTVAVVRVLRGTFSSAGLSGRIGLGAVGRAVDGLAGLALIILAAGSLPTELFPAPMSNAVGAEGSVLGILELPLNWRRAAQVKSRFPCVAPTRIDISQLRHGSKPL